MRLAFLGLAALVATSGLDVRHASAQESFFNSRYCTEGSTPGSSGMRDCSFNTWQQCQEAARGLGRYCIENPNWQPPARGKQQRDR